MSMEKCIVHIWVCHKRLSITFKTKYPQNKSLEAIPSNIRLSSSSTLRRAVHSSHQFFGEVTNQITNFKSPIVLFQVTKMCCMIQLWLRVRNVYRNWIIQHILVNWNRKIGELKLVTWLVTSPKNWWLEWTARLKTRAGVRKNIPSVIALIKM